MKETEQLLSWLKGKSIHNDKQCCPDFSCCVPQLLASFEEREAFIIAFLNDDNEQTDKMLFMFLGRAMNTITDKQILIAGKEYLKDCNA